MILATQYTPPFTFHNVSVEPITDIALLHPLWLGERPHLEQNPEFKQIIPYVIFKRGAKYLRYTRTKKGGESRLHSKTSIGFGGHVELDDCHLNKDGVIDLRPTLREAAQREVFEELYLTNYTFTTEFTHFIYNQNDDVGRVHLGLITIVELPQDHPTIEPKEDSISNLEFVPPSQLQQDTQLESWSSIIAGTLLDEHFQKDISG